MRFYSSSHRVAYKLEYCLAFLQEGSRRTSYNFKYWLLLAFSISSSSWFLSWVKLGRECGFECQQDTIILYLRIYKPINHYWKIFKISKYWICIKIFEFKIADLIWLLKTQTVRRFLCLELRGFFGEQTMNLKSKLFQNIGSDISHKKN